MINYYLIVKPGIILGNLITFTAGFLLASKAGFDLILFLTTFFGLGLIIASGCVFNNYIDRFIDKKMARTKDRALAQGIIKTRHALIYGTVLAIGGNMLLLAATNLMTVAVADFGFLVYVFAYSLLKGSTSYSTLIGSISGAVPPIVGYCAVSGRLDNAALLLFLMMIFWQMPHFFAIGLWRFEDYKNAGIPILPVSGGAFRTKVHILLYIAALIPVVSLLTILGYTGYIFLTATLAMSLVWLFLSIQGFSAANDVLWGRQMFRFSLLKINTICLLLPLDKI